MTVSPTASDVPAFLDRPVPVIAAPMAGSTTPALAAAVTEAGGLGFLAAGYLSAEAMAGQLADYRSLTDGPVAINLFTPQTDRTLELGARLQEYVDQVSPTAARFGTEPGRPTFDDDEFDAKIAHLLAEPVDAVSFTFGPVPPAAVRRLTEAGTVVGFTVTSAHEVREAVTLGARFLVAQGAEAGGHRGIWNLSDHPNELTAAEVTRAAIKGSGLPVVAAGGVADATDVRRLLDAGAVAVGVGTRFVAADESRAPAAHKAALTSAEFSDTTVTRAFSGRWARGLTNGFIRQHAGQAPSAYPNVHRVTSPIRAAAAALGDPHGLALWAGSGHRAATPAPAAAILRDLVP